MAKVKHVALWKFKEGTPPEKIDMVLQELLDVSETIPGIEDYVSGANNSPEGMNQGYTHGFVMTFENAEARDGYLRAVALLGLIRIIYEANARLRLDVNDSEVSIHAIFPLEQV